MDYVLVHGTTQSPRGWDRLAAALDARGHRAVPVDLLAGGADLDAEEYADLVAGQVAAATAEGPDGGDGGADGPAVVVHSGAGALAAAVAARLEASRVVWLAAFVPDTVGGRSLLDEMQVSAAQMFNTEWTQLAAPPTEDPVTAGYFLFHDGDLATLRWGLESVRLFQPARVFAQKPRPLPESAESTYLLPMRDRTLRPHWMRATAEVRLGVKAVEVDAGHCPHVSAPEEVAGIIAG
ncbi:alpha/beta hydrolase [Streptomonospora salina]|uniref:Pimeloyl-ACP methyl ester carboxylesterase n=1 Tax=Streptomonospora salina TaxID=104205 RepID=A0A841E510_9ACTN|nr:alpha/beta hydrolase [Streptomonospora salina]MBB5997862.1 pimeloyl-ACP methyl ester carboxylesterase [Streptomonospora salina]